jgi:hypothetical protein
MDEIKKPLTSLFRDNPATPEGKYLVKRRDGSTVEWPSFVLGARDPDGADTLRFYGLLKLLPTPLRDEMVREIQTSIKHWLVHPDGQNKPFVASVQKWARIWEQYREEHGDGDPLMGAHRKDDPATIAEMRKGMSA